MTMKKQYGHWTLDAGRWASQREQRKNPMYGILIGEKKGAVPRKQKHIKKMKTKD